MIGLQSESELSKEKNFSLRLTWENKSFQKINKGAWLILGPRVIAMEYIPDEREIHLADKVSLTPI